MAAEVGITAAVIKLLPAQNRPDNGFTDAVDIKTGGAAIKASTKQILGLPPEWGSSKTPNQPI